MDLDEEDDPDPDIDDDSVADNISNGQGNDEDNEIVDAQITDVHFDDKNPPNKTTYEFQIETFPESSDSLEEAFKDARTNPSASDNDSSYKDYDSYTTG